MDASKALLFATDLTKYKTLAFATHGYAGCDLPGIREPLLALTLVDQSEGQDGFLRMSEVIGLNMKANIVTLTGCMTGVGRHVTGEGPMFMGRAFQTAGAASVLISLWNIAEMPSVELTENFLKFIHEGKSKLEALRSARRETRKNYDHPFFWAAFILVGGDD
jgi:CHAT domain-containing protein